MDLPTSLYGATVTNQLKKPQTYIDCNQPIEVTHEQFIELLKTGRVYELSGVFDAASLSLIIKGVRCSTLVEERIKNLL